MEISYEYFKKSADYILSKIDFNPEVAMILGSELGALAEEIENPVIIRYEDIPNFLQTTVEGHAGELILGTLSGKRVVCISGRFHYYEGYDFEQLVIPIRVFKLLGVNTTILTNAAGAINLDYSIGDVMIIRDHIKLMGASPLRGRNISEFGPRFFDIGNMYTKRLRDIAKKCAANTELTVQEGVYYFYPGPQFESPAEIKAMRILGGDAAGMSTVTESLTAAHCDMDLLAISLLTNMAAGVSEEPVTSEEVCAIAKQSAGRLRAYLKDILVNI